MAVVLTLIIVILVGYLVKGNRLKKRKIKYLEKTLRDKIFECEQLEKMLLKYGKQK